MFCNQSFLCLSFYQYFYCMFSFLNKRFLLFILTCSACLFFSCRQIDIYEKNTQFKNHEWNSAVPAEGHFVIDDTLAYYNIYIVLRHTDAYKYNNIWINVGLQAPGDSIFFQKVNLSLGDDANGWEGSGMNDIWEVRKSLNTQACRFRKKGQYYFKLVNIMRDDPLQHVMSAGLRVEKAP